MRFSTSRKSVASLALLVSAWCVIAGRDSTAYLPASGELTLADCFSVARTNNTSLRKAVLKVDETRGEEIVAWSRLLPKLSLLFEAGADELADSSGSVSHGRNSALALKASQRIVEFGATTEEELGRISRRRKSLYDRENELVTLLSQIRSTYFAIRIVRAQRLTHDTLLAEYEAKLAQNQSRLENGVGVKYAVLTSRLNQLEERQRILHLRKRERELCNLLAEILGVARIPEVVQFSTSPSTFAMGEDSCVSIGIAGNTHLADARAEADIARKRLREWGWEFAPEISLSAGIQNARSSAGLELGRMQPGARKTWALDAVGTHTLVEYDSLAANLRPVLPSDLTANDPDLRYTAKVTIELPLLKGLQRVGEHKEWAARYELARNEVIDVTRKLEHTIRNEFGSYAYAIDQLAIEKERVDIARERYELAEALRDLGRMDENVFDDFRRQLFDAQDAFFRQQFSVLDAEEQLRHGIRVLH